MATVIDPVGTRSLRKELELFIKDVLSREDTVTGEKLLRLAHEHFNGDVWIQEALVREGLNSLLPQIATRVRHQLRAHARVALAPGETRREVISSIFEHVGDGITKSIFTMQRPDHLFVAREREMRAAGELRWAGLHRGLAALHKDDSTYTADLDPTKVAKVWRQHIENDS